MKKIINILRDYAMIILFIVMVLGVAYFSALNEKMTASQANYINANSQILNDLSNK
ncbi:MAG TPA: hypothetical protein IAB27_05420 [Candidatus Coprosoma intestinipullorum]|uniref:Uncharacterized protein n=1 Tax=Candidatus Coprosoma intestinipullorum TaxID=2840752 RepID=A0A9D0ZR89_9FIRM|nr:hypothetical protein [Candidatus Coprosoma intestinipullorum]